MATMQPVVATVVLRIGSTGLHCDGCMNRIRRKLYKIKGTRTYGARFTCDGMGFGLHGSPTTVAVQEWSRCAWTWARTR